MNAGLSKFLKSATFGVAALGLFAATPAKAVELTVYTCLLYTSPSPRDQRGSRMPSSA